MCGSCSLSLQQIKLSLREQQDIVAELKTVQKIRDCLDVVEIVMRFLASGGQKADDRLDNYLETALKMKHRFNCKKVSLIGRMRAMKIL